jgi:hypothetical protein
MPTTSDGVSGGVLRLPIWRYAESLVNLNYTGNAADGFRTRTGLILIRGAPPDSKSEASSNSATAAQNKINLHPPNP